MTATGWDGGFCSMKKDERMPEGVQCGLPTLPEILLLSDQLWIASPLDTAGGGLIKTRLK